VTKSALNLPENYCETYSSLIDRFVERFDIGLKNGCGERLTAIRFVLMFSFVSHNAWSAKPCSHSTRPTRRASLGRSPDSERFGHCHKIGDGPRIHFLHGSSAMNFHGNLFEVELVRDLLVP
jgi:hypothetical protein